MPPVSSSSLAASPAAEAHRLGRWFTAARREGLLALLLPEVWQMLCALLSFTCRDGARRFTVDQLGVALGLSREQALVRLDQLVQTEWQGAPLAVLERDAQGEITGAALAPLEILTGARAPLLTDTEPPLSALPVIPASSTLPKAHDLAASLEAVGLNPEQVERLVHQFPPERIQRQLDWLPARQARNPAALLIRAIEGDWGPPREAA